MKDLLSPFIKDNKLFNGAILVLISLNVLAIMLESVDSINERFGNELRTFELISVLIFTVEYILRLYAHRDQFLKDIFSFYAIVDLLAILPFYIPIYNTN